MNKKVRNFQKKYFNFLHITGILLCCTISIMYWYKYGQYSDNIFKNSLFIMATFGVLVGYFTFDLINSAIKKRKEK